MKKDQINRYSSSLSGPISAFTYVEDIGIALNENILFCGCNNGNVCYINLQSFSSYYTVVDLTVSLPSSFIHRGPVQCVLSCIHPKVSKLSITPFGMLFTGGMDHKIKVWNPSNTKNPLVQTLLGHNGIITSIVDSNDGSIVSCSSDGVLNVWLATSGRDSMLQPYFENVSTYNFPTGTWLSSLVIASRLNWTAFVSDSSGIVTLFRKLSIKNRIDKMDIPRKLIKHQTWKLHELGITNLYLISDEEYLITLSCDCTYKFVDTKSGSCWISISNLRLFRYVGCAYAQNENRLYLTDECGYLEVFSLSKSQVISTVQLLRPAASEKACITASHRFSILSGIIKAREKSHFFILLPFSSSSIVTYMKDPTQYHNGVYAGAYSGDITSWKFEADQGYLNFIGHTNSVIGVSTVTSHDNKSNYNDVLSSKSILPKLCKTENSLCSIGVDNTIRCWDCFDCKERFQIKMKGLPDILSCIVVWNYNTVFTGHETGYLCAWHLDSGNKITSKVMKEGILCLTEGRNLHTHFLICGDLSGTIGFYNLTLYDVNPTKLYIDFTIQGHHDPEEPSIICLGFHWSTFTIFSGGSDNTIRYWKISAEFSNSLVGHHTPVCSLEISDSFILSGDESGDMILRRISTEKASNEYSSTITSITIISKWSNIDISISSRALSQMFETPNKMNVYILQGGLIGKVILWKVEIKKHYKHAGGNNRRRVDPNEIKLFLEKFNSQSTPSEQKYNSAASDGIDLIEDTFGLNESSDDEDDFIKLRQQFINSLSNIETKDNRYKHQFPILGNAKKLSEYEINQKENSDIHVRINKIYEILLDKIETTSICMTCNDNFVPEYLYVGTLNGPVLRYEYSDSHNID